MLDKITKFHFVGIGGAGMSAIAKVLLQMGITVTGSDLNKSDTTASLEKLGAKIYIGHNGSNITDDVEAIVVSTAIPETNPELIIARNKNIRIFHRSDMVAALMDNHIGIAVAGAHGKTTTTSMIAVMLEKAGLDPTIIIGGEVGYLGGNAKYGKGKYMVAEADESDGSFLKLFPQLAVVTNIENDHMDYYQTMDNILKVFYEFLHNIPQNNGLGILCFDNEYVRNIASKLDRKYVSYALEFDADYVARNISVHGANTSYDVYYRGEMLGPIKLKLPGMHNVSNSLATVAIGLELGIDFNSIAEGLEIFTGAKRRFQTKAKMNGVWIVDDYAHHPTEIMTTLSAARQTAPKRIVCVFQPHRYSRTQLLQSEFGRSFSSADVLVLTDIYAAGETPIPGITGEVIKQEVERQTGQKVIYIPDKEKIARYLSELVEPGDLVITMGAGNIYQTGEELIDIICKA